MEIKKRCDVCCRKRVKWRKYCEYQNCHILPSYGELDTKNPNFCKEHAPIDYVNVVSKKCKHTECNLRASYVFNNKEKEYCKTHAPLGYYLPIKRCLHENCQTIPNYGKPGGKKEFCSIHAPEGHIDVVNKL